MEEQIKQNNPIFHRYLFTVTTFSKFLAMFLFILLPFVGFYLGMKYQQQLIVNIPIVSQNPQSNFNSKLTNQQMSQNKECESAGYYLKFLQQKFGNKINVKADTSENWSLNFFYWKRASTEPFIAYPEQVISVDNAENHTPEEINNAYSSFVDDSFAALGYVKDPLNTFSLVIPMGEGAKSWQYGYRKGVTLITVEIGSDQSKSNPNLSSIVVGCGVESSQYDELYTELLASTDVQSALKEAYGTNGLANMIFSIWVIHQNDIVSTDISSQDWYSGHSLWLHKEQGIWKAFYKGQNTPDCSTLENLHIEPGVSCWDQNNPSHTTTR